MLRRMRIEGTLVQELIGNRDNPSLDFAEKWKADYAAVKLSK